ncbi:uncharacterized protein LOC142319868 [Lycorma delicatula]|uniref:uncharacterized protein LOC142319868 n=1 Tax=Lycorma delicatula TaxID=130591 RepID=UPI003F5162A2
MSRKPPPTKSDYDFDFDTLPEIPLYALLPRKKSSTKPDKFAYQDITCFPEICRLSPDARYYTENELRMRELKNNPQALPCSVHISITDSTRSSTTSIKSKPRTSSTSIKSRIHFATDSTASLTQKNIKKQQSQQFPLRSSLMSQQQMMNRQMFPMISMPQQFPYPSVDMSQQFLYPSIDVSQQFPYPYPSAMSQQFPYPSAMSQQYPCLPDEPPAKEIIISPCCLPPPPPPPPCTCACLPDEPTPSEIIISQCCLPPPPPSPPCPCPPDPPVMECSCAPEDVNELAQDCVCAPPVNNSKFMCEKPCCLADRSSLTEQPPQEPSSKAFVNRSFAKYGDLSGKKNSLAYRSSGLQPLSYSAGNNQKQNRSVSFPKKLLKPSNVSRMSSCGRINPCKSTSGRLNSTTNDPEFMRSFTLPQNNTQVACPPSMHIFRTTSAENPSQSWQMNRMHKSQNQFQPMATSNLSSQKKNGNNSYCNGEICVLCGGEKNGYVNGNANEFQNFNEDIHESVNLNENNVNDYCSMEDDAFAVSGNGFPDLNLQFSI